MNILKRREFIKASLKYSVVPFCLNDLGIDLLKKDKIKVAIQLVSIIPSCNEDIIRSLHSIAQMGYKGV